MKEIDIAQTHTTSVMNGILRYIKITHDKHADGCKGSCSEAEIGYFASTYYDSFWFCRFGGYCLGDLSRNEEVQANSIEMLAMKVQEKIENAINKEQI